MEKFLSHQKKIIFQREQVKMKEKCEKYLFSLFFHQRKFTLNAFVLKLLGLEYVFESHLKVETFTKVN